MFCFFYQLIHLLQYLFITKIVVHIVVKYSVTTYLGKENIKNLA